jgi:hypothetical protein
MLPSNGNHIAFMNQITNNIKNEQQPQQNNFDSDSESEDLNEDHSSGTSGYGYNQYNYNYHNDNSRQEYDEEEEGDGEGEEEEELEDIEDDLEEDKIETLNNPTATDVENCLAAAQMMQLMVPTIKSKTPRHKQVSASPTSSTNDNGIPSPPPPPPPQLSSNNQSMVEQEKENVPICKYCNKIFANFSNLNHHISAIHLNQSKWVCSQCGKVVLIIFDSNISFKS